MAIRREDEHLRAFVLLFRVPSHGLARPARLHACPTSRQGDGWWFDGTKPAEHRSPIVGNLVAYRRRGWFPSTFSSAVRRPPAPRSWSWRSDRTCPIPRPEACRRTLLRRTSGGFPVRDCGGMAALPRGIGTVLLPPTWPAWSVPRTAIWLTASWPSPG